MTTQSGPRKRPNLQTQLAIALFGWQYREDWQCWCPPGWPPREVINPPYLDKLHALERSGGQPYGRSGAINEWGRPVIPSYQYDPDATEILWNWLYTQPGIQSVQFVPLPLPPESLQGVRRWRCQVTREANHLVTGEGDSHTEALCYAVLELATTHAASVG